VVVQLADAIADALQLAFDLPVYGERVRQGLETPCFLVVPVRISREHVRGGRYEQTHLFDVRYFDEAGDFDGAHDVADRLFDALEVVSLADGGKVRGSDMKYEIKEGVLLFSTMYRLLLYKEEEKTIMEDLQHER